jgi:hypothetical protein
MTFTLVGLVVASAVAPISASAGQAPRAREGRRGGNGVGQPQRGAFGHPPAEDVVAEDVSLEAEADAGRQVGGVENEAAARRELVEPCRP